MRHLGRVQQIGIEQTERQVRFEHSGRSHFPDARQVSQLVAQDEFHDSADDRLQQWRDAQIV